MTTRHPIRLVLALCVAIALGALTWPAFAATGVPTPGGGGGSGGGSGGGQQSLTLDSLSLAAYPEMGGTSTFVGRCNPLGKSTFWFRVAGSAIGPSAFPGTFVETGTFTLGPMLPMPDGNIVATPLAFMSTFTIQSTGGAVFGVKTLSKQPLEPFNFGACGEGAFFGFPNGVAIQIRADYAAVLMRGGVVDFDRGTSFVDYGDIGARPNTGIGAFGFIEIFTPQPRSAGE